MGERNVTKISCDFGRLIRATRERKGLTQGDIANLVDIGQAYYSLIENGKREIDLSLALRICTILEIDISDFAVSYMKKKKKPRR